MEIIQGSAPEGVFNASRNETPRAKNEMAYEALIVDLISDHRHKDYSSDGYNVGAAKIRIFSIHDTMPDADLPWAFPDDSTVVEYPLIGEVVTLKKVRGTFFYGKKVPIARRLQENAALKLNDLLNERGENTLKKAVQRGQQQNPKEHLFGKYFKPDSRVRQLKHFEGDVILQNRMGSTIRMGSSALDPTSKGLAPNLILRAGQGKDVEKDASAESVFGLITENIEKDPSSIWLVSGQTVPFVPITNKIGSFTRSLKNPVKKYEGAQIFVNSDRLILNAKSSHILLFAKEEIYLNAYKQIGIDTDGSIEISAHKEISLESNGNIKIATDSDLSLTAGKDFIFGSNTKFSLLGNKVFLGTSGNTNEPTVGGTSLSIFLARLILTLMGTGATPPQIPYQTISAPTPPLANILPKVITPGPAALAHVIVPGPVPIPASLNPLIIAGLTQLYTELILPNIGSAPPIPFSGAPFNSSDVFTAMSSQESSQVVQLNEFEDGEEPEVIENNTYNLSDNYYKVL